MQAQRPVCAFVGCRNPAQDCDLDHNIPWAQDGPLTVTHLAPLCPGAHTVRHHGWTYVLNPDGTITADHHSATNTPNDPGALPKTLGAVRPLPVN